MNMQNAPHSGDTSQQAAGFTGRFTAGLRFVESTCVPDALLTSDPLAGVLAGERGLALAKQELEQLAHDQGHGKHLRVPARSRLIDDMLQQEIAQLRSGQAAQPGTCGATCQVVSLGAGMCTRPWRLPCLAGCRVYEVDLPHIAATKTALLTEARAQTTSAAAAAAAAAAASVDPDGNPDGDPNGGTAQSQGGGQAAAPAPAFPLLACSYDSIGVDLSTAPPGALASELRSRCFDPAVPTIWVLEALLYYMPLAAASELLCQLAALSAPGSRLIATCVDKELLEASLSGVPKGHVFADLWHFETEALLYDTPAFRDCWQVDWAGQPAESAQAPVPDGSCPGAAGDQAGAAASPPARRLPASTRQLAKERLGADTYVALYGGSELLFACGLRTP